MVARATVTAQGKGWVITGDTPPTANLLTARQRWTRAATDWLAWICAATARAAVDFPTP
jgi:hypothetical protein